MAMGIAHYLPGQNAFTACVPRSTVMRQAVPPKKRGPKSNDKTSVTSESFEERMERKVLRDNSRNRLCTAIATADDAIKTAKIRGRSNDARTQ
jgi:hypothetical protein